MTEPPYPDPQEPEAGAKRGAVIEAAAHLFTTKGYSETSMDQVARSACVSKATVYAYYSSKAALLTAIIDRNTRRRGQVLEAAVTAGPDVTTVLRTIGAHFAETLLSPEGMAMYRLLVAETLKFPELGRAFFEAGPKQTVSAMADYLRGRKAAGELDIPDPMRAAQHFYAMIKAETFLRRLFLIDETGDPDRETRERQAAVEAAVDTFMRAFAPRERTR